MAGRTLLHFVETSVFTKQIDKLASMEILFDVQNDLLVNPRRGDLIVGTNGARKARIADRQKKIGKSGAYRYIYVFFEKIGIIYLLFFYEKSSQATLTGEQKKQVAQFISHAKHNHEDK